MNSLIGIKTNWY